MSAARRLRPLCLSLLLLAVTQPPGTQACTLWGAAGADAGDGTILSKNRDWKPDHQQSLKLVRPAQGYAYFGLYAEGNDEPGLKAGVNEKGLSIVSASSNIPDALRKNQSGKHGIMTDILRRFASIDALLPQADRLFAASHANFFMIADAHKLLVAEVGLDGRYRYKVVDQGTTAHTNHYLDDALAGQFQDKPGRSSATRLTRVTELLAQAPRPLSPEQFAQISRDHHDGPNNSLWRNGHEHTLASWIISHPKNSAPHLRVVLDNPGQEETTQEFTLDEAFWKKDGSQ